MIGSLETVILRYIRFNGIKRVTNILNIKKERKWWKIPHDRYLFRFSWIPYANLQYFSLDASDFSEIFISISSYLSGKCQGNIRAATNIVLFRIRAYIRDISKTEIKCSLVSCLIWKIRGKTTKSLFLSALLRLKFMKHAKHRVPSRFESMAEDCVWPEQ